jgi:hypothetical protein
MNSTVEGWKLRHREALRAYKRSDPGRLIELCGSEIEAEARYHEKTFRGAVPFDELAQAGRKAILEYWERYDYNRGVPFQAFIRPHIRGKMLDLIGATFELESEQRYFAYEAALQSIGGYEAEGAIPARKDDHEVVYSALHALLGGETHHDRAQKYGNAESLESEKAVRELVRLAEEGERDESAIVEQIEAVLALIRLEDWRYVVERNAEVARFFGSFLSQDYKELPRKYQEMMVIASEAYWKSVFREAAKTGRDFTVISGPLDMVVLQRQHKIRNPWAKPISCRQLSKLLGVSDKTIRAWQKRIEEAGPPPLLREDGSYTLKGQENLDAWTDYWNRIADPRSWRRLHRRWQEAK